MTPLHGGSLGTRLVGMVIGASTVLSEIRKLSVAERIRLVEDIWDAVAADAPDLPLTEPQRKELDERLAQADAHPGTGVPWSEVKARLLGRA